MKLSKIKGYGEAVSKRIGAGMNDGFCIKCGKWTGKVPSDYPYLCFECLGKEQG